MPRLVALSLIFLALSPAVAHAARHAPPLDWSAATQTLAPGDLIEVLPRNQAGPDLCRFSSSDSVSLTCLPEDAVSDVRLIFPGTAIESLWVIEPGKDRHIGIWIAVLLSTGLEIAACVGGGPLGGLLVGGIITAAWTAVDTPVPPWMAPLPARPAPRRLHRRLIYVAP